MNVNEIISNYYFAIQHSHYRNHLQKYYRFNFKNEWKNTLTTREHGLGELQDQATSVLLVFVVRVGHIIQARVLAEERSDLFVLLVCERLWEFRASVVFIVTVCTFLTCRWFICYTSPGHWWLSLLVSRVFPVLSFCFFPGGIYHGKNMNIPNYILYCHLGVCESCELLHQSPGFYMLWGIQSENRRIPARSSNGASRMTARESPDRRQAWALYRHRRISVRWPGWHRAVIGRRLPDLRSMTCGFFPLHFGRWPPDRRSMIGRCPTGRRRMRKSGEESADHPANFNCELNLPDHRRMSPGWVPNRWMAAGFLQDSSPGSPHGDPAIDFAQLWRSYKELSCFHCNCSDTRVQGTVLFSL